MLRVRDAGGRLAVDALPGPTAASVAAPGADQPVLPRAADGAPSEGCRRTDTAGTTRRCWRINASVCCTLAHRSVVERRPAQSQQSALPGQAQTSELDRQRPDLGMQVMYGRDRGTSAGGWTRRRTIRRPWPTRPPRRPVRRLRPRSHSRSRRPPPRRPTRRQSRLRPEVGAPPAHPAQLGAWIFVGCVASLFCC